MRPPPTSTLFPYTTLFRSHVCQVHGARGTKECIFGYWDQDRKSTRLNSSHVAISYAVFCLKKKKTRDILALELKLAEQDRLTNKPNQLKLVKSLAAL